MATQTTTNQNRKVGRPAGSKSTYCAITTTGGDWYIVAIGHDRQKVADEALAQMSGHDITSVTERKNLVVLSKTKAQDWLGLHGADFVAWVQSRVADGFAKDIR